MADIAEIGFKVNTAPLERARRELDRLGSQGKETGREMSGLAGQMTTVGGAARTLRAAVSGVIGALAVREVAQMTAAIGRAQIQFESINRSLRFATGSAEGAADAFAFVQKQADRMGLDLVSAARSFGRLSAAARGTALEGEASREIFLGISEAATVLGMSADETEGALIAIQQMISKGTVSAEELRGQLGERLPGAFQIAARAMGVTTQELGKMLEQGQVIADDFLPKFIAEVRRSFSPEVAASVNSLQAETNRLNTAWTRLQANVAKGLPLAEGASGLAGIVDTLNGLIEGARAADEAAARVAARARVSELEGEIVQLSDSLESASEKLERLMMGRRAGSATAQQVREQRALVNELEESLRRARREQESLRSSTVSDAPADPAGALGGFGGLPAGALPGSSADPAAILAGASAAADFADQQIRVREIMQSLQTPTERDAEQVRELAELYSAGAFTGEGGEAAFQETLTRLGAGFEGGGDGGDSGLEATASRAQSIIDSLATPAERAAEAIMELNEAARMGAITNEQFQEAAGRIGERLASISEQEETFATLQRGISSALVRGVQEGGDGMLAAFTSILAQMATQALQKNITGLLFGDGGGGGGGGLFGAVAGAFGFGGARANGGPVTGGTTYLVGERGPELFQPKTSGAIIPNNAMGGSVTYAPTVTINGGASEEDRLLVRAELARQQRELIDLRKRGQL